MAPQRRLSDKIIAAHEQACAEGRLDIADILLQALQTDLSAIGGKKREYRGRTDQMEAAFARHERFRRNG